MSTAPIPALPNNPGVAAKTANTKTTTGLPATGGAEGVENSTSPGNVAETAPVQGKTPDTATSTPGDGSENSFAQQLQRAEQQQQSTEAVVVKPPVQSDVESPETGEGELLEQIGELIAAGETVEVSGVPPVQTSVAGPQPVSPEPAQVVTQAPAPVLPQQPTAGQQPAQEAGMKLPQGGQSLPPAAAATANEVATQPPPAAVTANGQPLPVAKEAQNPAANRTQPELPQQPDIVRQPQVEMPARKLESALPEAIRTVVSLESSTSSSPVNSSPTSVSLSVVTTSTAAPITPTTTSGAALQETGIPRPVISMNTPLGEQGWAQEAGTRLRVLVEQGNQRAEIRLNPPELGSVEVKVVNDGERTNVTFFAQNGATREALEAAMPRLREMFNESGLQLADANVSQQQTMAGEREASQANGGAGFGADNVGAEQESVETVSVVSSNNLVDYYI